MSGSNRLAPRVTERRVSESLGRVRWRLRRASCLASCRNLCTCCFEVRCRRWVVTGAMGGKKSEKLQLRRRDWRCTSPRDPSWLPAPAACEGSSSESSARFSLTSGEGADRAEANQHDVQEQQLSCIACCAVGCMPDDRATPPARLSLSVSTISLSLLHCHPCHSTQRARHCHHLRLSTS